MEIEKAKKAIRLLQDLDALKSFYNEKESSALDVYINIRGTVFLPRIYNLRFFDLVGQIMKEVEDEIKKL